MASQYVADGGVGVPNPEDESLLAAAEPVRHDGHDAGPTRGLEDAAGYLDQEEEKELLWSHQQKSTIAIVQRDTSGCFQGLVDIKWKSGVFVYGP